MEQCLLSVSTGTALVCSVVLQRDRYDFTWVRNGNGYDVVVFFIIISCC
jgi:hypothetical protein